VYSNAYSTFGKQLFFRANSLRSPIDNIIEQGPDTGILSEE